MKKTFLLAMLCAAIGLSAQKSAVTLKEAIKEQKYRSKGVWGVTSMQDGKHYTTLVRTKEGIKVLKSEYSTGKQVDVLFDGTRFPEIKQIATYTLSPDEQQILIHAQQESIYRRSTKAIYYVYDIEDKSVVKVSDNKISAPVFSHSGQNIAYVYKNNIYYFDIEDKKTTQVTQDGQDDKIINGIADWVYEEEFYLFRTLEWSLDDEYIVYQKFEEQEVKKFSMDIYGQGLYPSDLTFKYPKAGETNSKVSLFAYELDNEKTNQIQFEGMNEDVYIARFSFSPNGNLVFTTLNRHQNDLKLWTIDIETADESKAKVFLTERSNTYIEVNDYLTFLKDGSFLWLSEKDGYNHIYHHNPDGTLINQLTSGPWEVTDFYGIDPNGETAYFQSTQDGSINRTLATVDIISGAVSRLTNKIGTNSAYFSATMDFHIRVFHNVDTPPQYALVKTKTKKVIRVLEDNKALNQQKDKHYFAKKEFEVLKLSNGSEVNSWMMKPQNFDAKKSYPVLMFVYGGPGSQTVANRWYSGHDYFFLNLVEKGYIVVSVDNTGTGFKGADFKKKTYKELGKYEIADQIAAAQLLGTRSYINQDRIGIFGWSFGGFMTLLGVSKGAEIFKTGISVAPVTSWRFYDSIYTERYMQTPNENSAGYDTNSPINHVDKIKNNFLLIHGSGDDNVHFQNSMRIVSKLIEADKQFEQFVYPDKNHGIYGGNTRYHLYQMMEKFLQANL